MADLIRLDSFFIFQKELFVITLLLVVSSFANKLFYQVKLFAHFFYIFVVFNRYFFSTLNFLIYKRIRLKGE
jgi:hypothetical protein